MKNRKDKDIKNILDEIAYHWNLSIKEEDILDSFLNVLKDGNVSKLQKVEYLLNKEYEELLETIPDSIIERYCENELDMVDSTNEEDLLYALNNLNFDWSGAVDIDVAIEICNNEGYEVIEKESSSLVEDMQMEEMKELFLSLSCAEKEELISKLKRL